MQVAFSSKQPEFMHRMFLARQHEERKQASTEGEGQPVVHGQSFSTTQERDSEHQGTLRVALICTKQRVPFYSIVEWALMLGKMSLIETDAQRGCLLTRRQLKSTGWSWGRKSFLEWYLGGSKSCPNRMLSTSEIDLCVFMGWQLLRAGYTC